MGRGAAPIESQRGLTYCLAGPAGVAATQNQWERAAQMLGATEALAETLYEPYTGGNRIVFEFYKEAARAHLDDRGHDLRAREEPA